MYNRDRNKVSLNEEVLIVELRTIKRRKETRNYNSGKHWVYKLNKSHGTLIQNLL